MGSNDKDRSCRLFFLSVLLFGIASGCYGAILNNYLADIRQINEFQRGLLEFFREMPGLLLVFILAAMSRWSDWKIMKAGTLISAVGAAGLMLSERTLPITILIVVWSAGEHILMPCRNSLAISLAKADKFGKSLGLVTSFQNAGSVTGNLLAAGIFYIALERLQFANHLMVYKAVWGLVVILAAIAIAAILMADDKSALPVKRPKLYFSRKYGKFYALELFYGARKQIFLTFGPYVLILIYGINTKTMAMLLAVSALCNIFFAPMIGKLTDRIGYKNIMIYDTVFLFFICIVYGYADKIFPGKAAYFVVCANYVLDAIISTAAMATNLYVKDIAANQDEMTSSYTTGVSINHLIAIITALVGGFVWHRWGVGVLFAFAAIMALANSAFAMTIPKPKSQLP